MPMSVTCIWLASILTINFGPGLIDLLPDQNAPDLQVRGPIYGPISQGDPADASTGPSEEEIIHELAIADNSEPWSFSIRRTDVRITRQQKIADYLDPPRTYPLIGPAQVHHFHYKCSVTFNDTRFVPMLLFVTTRRNVTTDVYVDHSHLHVCNQLPVKSTDGH